MIYMKTFKENFKKKAYLAIPIISIVCWSLLYLIFFYGGFKLDFRVFYAAGRQILIDPTNLYQVDLFYYTPFLPTIFSFSLSLLPPLTANFIWFALNYVFGILMILEFDRILQLKGISKVSYKLLFLIIISNGWSIYLQFFWNQTKFLVCFILLFILRRHIQDRENTHEKSIKERVLIFLLFDIVISISPFLIFIVLIYIFSEINIKDMFKQQNLYNYIILISLFFLLNILFIIFPQLILDFLFNGVFGYNDYINTLKLLYTFKWLIIPDSWQSIITILSISILSMTTIILIYRKDINLEIKIGLFSLSYLIFSTFARFTDLILFIPFLLLLFIPYISLESDLLSFLKNNVWVILGLLSVLGVAFAHYDVSDFFEYFPFTNILFFKILVYLRYGILLALLSISLAVLYFQHRDS